MYYNPNDIRIAEIDTPEIDEDEVLVNMKACGICGSDLMDWYLSSRAPIVLGHEPAGIIVEKGSEVEDSDVGDRVFVHHHVACLKCYYCLRGDYTLCKQFHETSIKPGGFAEYFKVPEPNLLLDTLKIPKTVSFEEATLIEPAGCCIRSLRKCSIKEGDSIVIIGAGTTGIIHAVLSKIFHAARTIVSDLIDYRLDAAKKLGADTVVNSANKDLARIVHAETSGIGADIVVVTAPSLDAYKTGLNLCRKGGKLCIFAPTSPENRLHISPNELLFSEIQLISSYSTSHFETREALELMASGQLDVKGLITHRFKLVDTAKAFRTALENKSSLKTVILNE